MGINRKNLHRNILHIIMQCALCSIICIGFATSADAAARARASVSRGGASAGGRAPVAKSAPVAQETANTASKSEPESVTVTETKPAPAPVSDEEPAFDPDTIIENKSSLFDDVLDETNASGGDAAANDLAAKIRAQRAALDAQDAATTAAAKSQSALSSGQNACDQALRACMKEKCGNDYSKCKGDGDTIWGDKMDSCRRNAECTGEEYNLFSAEIKADRDMNAKMSNYNAIIDCGNQYNDCIFTECGTTFAKCLGKSGGDQAIAACEKIAKNCTQQDNGLASRMMSAFGAVRQDAEKSVQRDEEKLYKMRDAMASTCQRLGAMLDERSMDCVFTVNFFAGEDNTAYASKKAYAGSVFDCDQNWFGIDITTFKENAYRLTRSQTAASSAMLGSGVGMAVGAVTSGAINRSLDRQKAEKAAKAEEKAAKKEAKAEEKAAKKEERQAKKDAKAKEKAQEKADKQCADGELPENATDGKKKNGVCVATKCKPGYKVKDGICEADISKRDIKEAREEANKPENVEARRKENMDNAAAEFMAKDREKQNETLNAQIAETRKSEGGRPTDDEMDKTIACENAGGAYVNGNCITDKKDAKDIQTCSRLKGGYWYKGKCEGTWAQNAEACDNRKDAKCKWVGGEDGECRCEE